MKKRILKETKGLSLIELLVALGVSSILMAGLYRTYIGQQRAYTVEDQVVDMQQNVRVSVGQMMREVRMAGYGGNILTAFGNVNGFTNIITPVYHANNVGTNDDSITIIIAEQVSKLNQNAAKKSFPVHGYSCLLDVCQPVGQLIEQFLHHCFCPRMKQFDIAICLSPIFTHQIGDRAQDEQTRLVLLRDPGDCA